MSNGKLITIPSDSPYVPSNQFIGTIDLTDYNYLNNRKFRVNDVNTTDIRNILNHHNNNVSDLCKSSNINMFALYRPNKLEPYNLADFAGYNHNAKAHTHFISNTVSGLFDPITKNLTLSVDIARGERPPHFDNLGNWNNVKVNFRTNSGSSFSFNLNVFGEVPFNSLGSPNHLITVIAPSQTFTLNLTITAYYGENDLIETFNTTYVQQLVITNKTVSLADYNRLFTSSHHVYTNGQFTVNDYTSVSYRGETIGEQPFNGHTVLISEAEKNKISGNKLHNGFYLPYAYSVINGNNVSLTNNSTTITNHSNGAVYNVTTPFEWQVIQLPVGVLI